ncbi:MAG: hypothetical protein E6Q98_15715 [Rhodospirillaceae bacterium]|nr:MAG: hypothetical protein E6Q98_15715 [Rhodospirillaceae bacterium]
MLIDIKEYRRLKRIEKAARTVMPNHDPEYLADLRAKARQFRGSTGNQYISNRRWLDLYDALNPATPAKEAKHDQS